MGSSSFKAVRYTDRWFCYFDLLGFTHLVNDQNIDRIIPTYEEVLEEIEVQAGPKAKLGVSYSWFSDTFILFSRRGTDRAFTLVEQAGRLFFQKLIAKHVPARGALTYGKLYSQVARNIFVGPALIDAYRYGESQDWLGFILTPSVYTRCLGTVLDLRHRAHYRRVETPGVIRHEPSENIYAFAFNNGRVNGANPYLEHIRVMRNEADSKYRQKYLNTEAFLLLHDEDSRRRAVRDSA